MKQLFFSILIAFAISLIFYYFYIKYAKKLQQTERELGPASHKKKNGTITMGGIVFVITTIVVYLFQIRDIDFKKTAFLILPFLSFFILGFVDDYLIVVKKNNEGIKAGMKLFLQIIIATICFILYLKMGLSTKVNLFGYYLELKWLYGILILLMLISSSNACNITDGVDGLCGGVTVIALIGFLYMALELGEKEVSIFICAFIGALLGFLYYNLPKAKLFMGDTGSLAIGAALASISILLKQELMILLLGGVFVIETLSVIIQVTYFKLTKGKRIFKMAPLHHHMELSKISETMVIMIFYGVSIIFCFLGILLFNFIR